MRSRFLLPVLLVLFTAIARANAASDEQVERSMELLRRYLYANQSALGTWPIPTVENSPQRGGDTALMTLALLTSGQSYQEARLARAIAWLRDAKLTGTYAVALRAQVWAALPDEFRPQLEADMKWLLDAADGRGGFRYVAQRMSDNNHSTTHFGVLGLWECGKRGLPVPAEFWQRSAASWCNARRPDGGWGYTAGTPSYGSMTAAGVASLLIARQQMQRDSVRPDPTLQDGIDSGLRWLDSKFDARVNPGSATGHHFYYLFAVERVALASGARTLNRYDWFDSGAEYIFERQRGDDGSRSAGSIDGSLVDSAFALMFLSRGRVPVWATKLTIAGIPCTNRPNDLHFLTSYLSDLREGELAWQMLPIDGPVDLMLTAPVAFLSSDRAITLTDAQAENLRRYLDLGGTLLASPDSGSEPFAQSIRALAARLHPQWQMRRLPSDHALFNALQRIESNAASPAPPVHGVSNGVRELIVLADRDWGFAYQSEHPPGQSMPWKVATNLWTIVTDRGIQPNRLVRRIEKPATGEPKSVLAVACVTPKGQAVIEPGAWTHLGRHLFNRTGAELRQTQLSLDELAGCEARLTHLGGIDAHHLTATERTAIERYVRGGGTLLVETVGGKGGFSKSFEGELIEQFGGKNFVTLAAEPVITGKGIDRGYDATRVTFRRVLASTAPGHRPRLNALVIDGRPAIIFAHDDLSMGVMGLGHHGILGYDPDSARRLMTNIVLWAARPPRGEPK